MLDLTRRGFGGLLAASAAMLTAPRALAAGGVSFMSFTYAEDPNRGFVEALLEGFAASGGPAVEPIGSAWGEMQRNLLLRQRSRTLPTTAQLSERWLPAVGSLPEVVDLDALLGRAALEAAIDPKILAMGQTGGRTLGLPLITGSIGMLANSEVLAAAGVDETPATLDAFRAALVKVRDAVPNSVPFAPATKNPNSIPLDFMILVWTHGGRMIDEDGNVLVDSAEGRAAMEFMVGLMRDRLIAPEIDRPDARRLFAQGACAFYNDAPQARTFARSFSGRDTAADAFVRPVAAPVLRAGDQPVSIQWGHLVTAFQGPEIEGPDSPGAQWLRYLISDAAQTTFPPALSALPVTRSAQAAPAVANDPYFTAWAAATGTPLTNEIGVWSNAPDLSAIVSEEVQAAILGQKPAGDAVAAMQSRLAASMAARG